MSVKVCVVVTDGLVDEDTGSDSCDCNGSLHKQMLYSDTGVNRSTERKSGCEAVVCRSIQNKKTARRRGKRFRPPSNEYITEGYDTRNTAALCYSLKLRSIKEIRRTLVSWSFCSLFKPIAVICESET